MHMQTLVASKVLLVLTCCALLAGLIIGPAPLVALFPALFWGLGLLYAVIIAAMVAQAAGVAHPLTRRVAGLGWGASVTAVVLTALLLGILVRWSVTWSL